MSQHPSLRFDSVSAKHRNVLKRFERVKTLQEQDKWQERTSVYGLPKVKSMKIKIKKSHGAPTEEGGETAAPALAAKEAATAKGEKAKK